MQAIDFRDHASSPFTTWIQLDQLYQYLSLPGGPTTIFCSIEHAASEMCNPMSLIPRNSPNNLGRHLAESGCVQKSRRLQVHCFFLHQIMIWTLIDSVGSSIFGNTHLWVKYHDDSFGIAPVSRQFLITSAGAWDGRHTFHRRRHLPGESPVRGCNPPSTKTAEFWPQIPCMFFGRHNGDFLAVKRLNSGLWTSAPVDCWLGTFGVGVSQHPQVDWKHNSESGTSS